MTKRRRPLSPSAIIRRWTNWCWNTCWGGENGGGSMIRQPGLPEIVHVLAFSRIVLQERVESVAGLIELALLRQHAGQSRDGFKAARINREGRLVSLTGLRRVIIVGQQVALRIGVVCKGLHHRSGSLAGGIEALRLVLPIID